MATMMRIGKLGWAAVAALALLALPAGAQDKLADLANGKDQPQDLRAGEPAADALLQQLAKEEKWRRERAEFLAEHYTKAGIARFNDLEFEAAKAEFEKALQQDPARTDARDYLRKTDAILGIRTAGLAKDLADKVRIEQEIARQQMKVAFDAAKALLDKGEYDDAIAKFQRVRDLAQWLAPHMNVEPMKTQAEDCLKKAESGRTARQAREKELERTRAAAVAQAHEQQVRDRQEQRIASLLAKGRTLLAEGRYAEAQTMAESVLELDPANTEARKLRDLAFNAGVANLTAETNRNAAQELQLQVAQMRQAQVPNTRPLTYPADWDRIAKRKAQSIGTENEQEPPWMPDLKAKLEQKVSFDFVETPLQDVVTFLQQVTGSNIVLDQKSLSGMPRADITLKVTDMKLGQALDWIVEQADMRYALRNSAIFIGDRKAVRGQPQLRFYDITDLTMEVRDFPGDLRLLNQRTGNSIGSGPDVSGPEIWNEPKDPKDPVITGKTIEDLIKRTIDPDDWEEETVLIEK